MWQGLVSVGATGSFSRCSARPALGLAQVRPAHAGRVCGARVRAGQRGARVRGTQSGASQQQLAPDGRDRYDFDTRSMCAPAAEAWSLGRTRSWLVYVYLLALDFVNCIVTTLCGKTSAITAQT